MQDGLTCWSLRFVLHQPSSDGHTQLSLSGSILNLGTLGKDSSSAIVRGEIVGDLEGAPSRW